MDNFDSQIRRDSDSQDNDIPDFRVNQFSEQAQFPQFTESVSMDDIQARIQAAKSNGWGAQLAGFVSQNKKRVLVLISIIALFAASSYLSDKSNEVTGADKKSAGVAGVSQNLPDFTDSSDNQSASPVPLDIKLGEDGQVIINEKNPVETPEQEVIETSDAITVAAQYGEGITHLARYALADYLADSKKTLSAEQKVYAEDYVQNKTGLEMLEIGQKLTFSKDLLGDAVDKAEALESWQIENLTQYTTQLSLL